MKDKHDSNTLSRRNLLKLTTSGVALGASAFTGCVGLSSGDKGAIRGRINQSVVHWCWCERGGKDEQTAKA